MDLETVMAILMAIYFRTELFPASTAPGSEVSGRNEQSLRDNTLDNPGGVDCAR